MAASREEKTAAWAARRARAGTKSKVWYSAEQAENWPVEILDVTYQNDNRQVLVEVDHLHCPCNCHEFSWECEEARCLCCSESCD